jgi:hypothetical protein
MLNVSLGLYLCNDLVVYMANHLLSDNNYESLEVSFINVFQWWHGNPVRQ